MEPINTLTDIYCIFGNPVKHSLSPLIHNSAFKKMNINAFYCAFEPTSISEAVTAMKTLNIKGASVTIPFKINALDCVDIIDDHARDIGSLNTLVNNNGTVTGYNTDGDGALEAIEKRSIPVSDSHVMIIGNGGSARAIAFTLVKKGARLTIAGRNQDKITALSRELGRHGPSSAILLQNIEHSFTKDVDIIINTTPLGMTPDIDNSPLPDECIPHNHAVFDIVYSPNITKLLASAMTKKCIIIPGIEMLVNQALLQFKIWTGLEAPEATIVRAVKNHLRRIN